MRLLLLALILAAGAAFAGEPVACRIDTVAGGGIPAGDGGPAVDAELGWPSHMAVGPDGLVYIAELDGHRIRRILSDGTIETFAGTGEAVSSGDGGPASAAGLRAPRSIAFAPDGSLYVLEGTLIARFSTINTSRIRRISPEGLIYTIAGKPGGQVDGDGGPAVEAGVSGTTAITTGPDGSIYLTVGQRGWIRKISPDGIIDRFAGYGSRDVPYLQEGIPALDARLGLSDVAVAPDGTVYVLEFNNRIRRIGSDGLIELYSGGGQNGENGAPRLEARIDATDGGLEVDALGRVYWNTRQGVKRISIDGFVEPVWGFDPPVWLFDGLLIEGSGRLFYLQSGRRILLELTMSPEPVRIAGVGWTGPWGDGGPATAAVLGRPYGLAPGSDGTLYIADLGLGKVRMVKDGVITTIAGTGETISSGDGGLATEAGLRNPQDVAIGPGGVYILDGPYKIRRIRDDGIIKRFTGEDTNCDERTLNACGDGGPAVDASMDFIRDIAADSLGNFYILHDDRRNTFGRSIRKVTPDGIIQTLSDALPDGGRRGFTTAIAVDDQDRLVVATEGPARIDSLFWRVSEGEEYVLLEEMGGLTQAPATMAAGGGDLFIAEGDSILRAAPGGILNVLLPRNTDYTIGQGDGGPSQQAYAGSIAGIAATDNAVYFSDIETHTVRMIDLQNCPAEARPVIFQRGIVNAASFQTALAPGSLFTVFGRGLGPAEGVGARIENGRLTTELGGVRVLVNGIPAPIVFASEGQVNAILPWATPADTGATVIVEHQGLASELRAAMNGIYVRQASPAFFSIGDGLAAAINQDGSINGPDNPAAPGTVVALYGTGGGATEPLGVDGQVTGAALASPVAPVSLTIGGRATQALYAGTAPGLVAGVLQVNAKIAEDAEQGLQPVVLTVGDAQSPDSMGVYVRR